MKYKDEAFAKNLTVAVKRYCKINGKKVSDLAKVLGVSRVTIYNYLENKNMPNAKHLKPLADELGVEVADLFKEN